MISAPPFLPEADISRWLSPPLLRAMEAEQERRGVRPITLTLTFDKDPHHEALLRKGHTLVMTTGDPTMLKIWWRTAARTAKLRQNPRVSVGGSTRKLKVFDDHDGAAAALYLLDPPKAGYRRPRGLMTR